MAHPIQRIEREIKMSDFTEEMQDEFYQIKATRKLLERSNVQLKKDLKSALLKLGLEKNRNKRLRQAIKLIARSV